jgi:hypothetical protein
VDLIHDPFAAPIPSGSTFLDSLAGTGASPGFFAGITWKDTFGLLGSQSLSFTAPTFSSGIAFVSDPSDPLMLPALPAFDTITVSGGYHLFAQAAFSATEIKIISGTPEPGTFSLAAIGAALAILCLHRRAQQ